MAARDVFMDSAGCLALWDASDEHHQAARRLQEELAGQRRRFVTSDYVVDETITCLARCIAWTRTAAISERSRFTKLTSGIRRCSTTAAWSTRGGITRTATRPSFPVCGPAIRTGQCVSVPDEDLRVCYLWLDAQVPFFGTYEEEDLAAQKLARSIRPPPLQ